MIREKKLAAWLLRSWVPYFVMPQCQAKLLRRTGGSTQAAKLLKASPCSFGKRDLLYGKCLLKPQNCTTNTLGTSMEQPFSTFTILYFTVFQAFSGKTNFVMQRFQTAKCCQFLFSVGTCFGTGTLGRICRW